MAVVLAFLFGAVAAPPPDQDAQRVRAPVIAWEPGSEEDYQPHLTPPGSGTPAAKRKDNPGASRNSQSTEHDTDHGDEEEGAVQPNSAIVVTAHRLDAARTQIDAGLGSTVYSLTNDTIENRPGGETGSLAQTLSQAPGVTLSGRTLNVRGSPANQVRINNVIVPEAISDPADLLSSRLAQTTRLITGTLPAQFGFAPAGVISVTTKNGLYQHGGQAEMFAGSDGMFEPAFEWAGSADQTSLFASGDLERGHSIVADSRGATARDRRVALEGLGFADHVIDAGDRVSMIVGGSRERHRFGPTSIGAGTDENDDGFAVGTFQHSGGGFTVQASAFGGVATDESRFTQSTRERRSTAGTQIDATDQLGPTSTVRFGLLASRSTADELDARGDRSSASRTAVALYAQDEWKITPTFTFNPGARLEWLSGFGRGAMLEPRASFVWRSRSGLTAHIGYARYASAPPLGERSNGVRLRDERDDYLDAGIQQRLGSLTLGLDGYWRSAHNYIAEHHTIGSVVPEAFAFRRARIEGFEFSATYARGPATAWANLSVEAAKARTIVGGQALFSPAVIADPSQWLPLASERPVTASGGLTWRIGKVSLGADVLASSGAVRTLEAADPNGSRHSAYAVLGLSAVYHARIAGQPADLRMDVTNLTNSHYATKDATALEGGWTRWGAGRAISIGIEQGF